MRVTRSINESSSESNELELHRGVSGVDVDTDASQRSRITNGINAVFSPPALQKRRGGRMLELALS